MFIYRPPKTLKNFGKNNKTKKKNFLLLKNLVLLLN